MYARRAGDRELTFDFAEGLIKDNLLFVDRETKSIWSQLDGKAVSGPLAGAPLNVIPSVQTTWKFWREKYPRTTVLIVQGETGRPYLYRNRTPGMPPPRSRPATHDVSALGLGLSLNGEAVYFPFSELAKTAAPFDYRVGGRDIVVYFNKKALTAWAEDAAGRLLPGVLAYRSGWLSFNPGAKIFSAK